MAEHEPTPEQLAAIAAENEESETVNYKPPAQKTLQEIQDLDKEDESLRKYKEALLGAASGPIGRCVGVCEVRVCVRGVCEWVSPRVIMRSWNYKNIFLIWNKTILNEIKHYN